MSYFAEMTSAPPSLNLLQSASQGYNFIISNAIVILELFWSPLLQLVVQWQWLEACIVKTGAVRVICDQMHGQMWPDVWPNVIRSWQIEILGMALGTGHGYDARLIPSGNCHILSLQYLSKLQIPSNFQLFTKSHKVYKIFRYI